MNIQSSLLTILRFVLAAAGLIFLSCGSFSGKQFENDTNWKAMFFISFSLSVAVFVYMPQRCNDLSEKLSHMHFFIKAFLKFLLLGFYSMVLFFARYPRLKIHSKAAKEQGEKLSNGNRNDLFGVGSFSVLALVISWERKQSVEFGLFEYLLELTMDASMEIPGHGGGPNLWFMLCAYVCCFLLLIIKSYREYSLMGHRNSTSFGSDGSNQDQLVRTNSVGIHIDGEPLRTVGASEEEREAREDMLDGETSEENHEVDGLRRRRGWRKMRQERSSSKYGSDGGHDMLLDGEALDEELSKYEVAVMESRLAKAQLILPQPQWELHRRQVRDHFLKLQNLLGALDMVLTSSVAKNCAVM